MDPNTSSAGKIGLGVVAGVMIAALILVGGLGYVLTRSHNWSAKATAVVLPDPKISSQIAASYYDTLSRGQIVETYAEDLRLKKFQNASAAGINLSAAQAKKATITVSVVPNTALITIEATSTTGPTAEALADGVFTQGSAYIKSLAQPYVLDSVSAAKGTATESTSHTGGFLAVLVVVALVVGLAVQQAVSQLVNTRRKTVAAMAPAASPVAPTVPQAFAPPLATPAPAAPTPLAVRPTVPDRRQRPRWPAEPVDNDVPEHPDSAVAESAGQDKAAAADNGKPEAAGKGKPEPAGKSKSEPAGNGKATPGRVEERIPES